MQNWEYFHKRFFFVDLIPHFLSFPHHIVIGKTPLYKKLNTAIIMKSLLGLCFKPFALLHITIVQILIKNKKLA